VADPTLPVMMGLLAVPVGVLLFVLALSLLGGRWSVPAPAEDPPAPLALEPPRQLRALPAPVRRIEPSQDLVPLPRAYGSEPRTYGSGYRTYGSRPAEQPRQQQYEPWLSDRSGETYTPEPYRPVTRDPYRARESYGESEPEPQRFPYGPYRHE
jgi:hypothetical protein